jgi:hypothetical protein
MVIGSATLPGHAVTARESRANKSSLWVVTIYPSLAPLHMAWLNRFRVLSLKACGTLRYSRETAQVVEATPIRVPPAFVPGKPQ